MGPSTHGIRHIILFDGVCNLCNDSVNFVIDRDPDAIFEFGALQSEEAEKLLAGTVRTQAQPDSVILVVERPGLPRQVYFESDAALRIAAKMPFPWGALRIFQVIPRPIRDGVYRWIARNRYRWFGRREACMIPEPGIVDRFIDPSPSSAEARNISG